MGCHHHVQVRPLSREVRASQPPSTVDARRRKRSTRKGANSAAHGRRVAFARAHQRLMPKKRAMLHNPHYANDLSNEELRRQPASAPEAVINISYSAIGQSAILDRTGLYSIRSSARTSNASGIFNPRIFAVAVLMTSSNLVACSTGISLGLVPCSILSTYSAARRNMFLWFGP